jgi:hypothetical protein
MGDKMKFENMIRDGENSKGFTGQTANGTAHWKGTGWNSNTRPVEKTTNTSDYTGELSSPQLTPDATRPAGRSNRTGE